MFVVIRRIWAIIALCCASTSSAHYGAGKKSLLEQKAKLQELFDSVLYRSMTGELDMVK